MFSTSANFKRLRSIDLGRRVSWALVIYVWKTCDQSCVADKIQVTNPLPGSPIVVFVNSKSGGGHGDKFLRRFKNILNPGQVFDIAQDGPSVGWEIVFCTFAVALKNHHDIQRESIGCSLVAYRHLSPLRLIVCGGDGSVGWVLKEIDKLNLKVSSNLYNCTWTKSIANQTLRSHLCKVDRNTKK